MLMISSSISFNKTSSKISNKKFFEQKFTRPLHFHWVLLVHETRDLLLFWISSISIPFQLSVSFFCVWKPFWNKNRNFKSSILNLLSFFLSFFLSLFPTNQSNLSFVKICQNFFPTKSHFNKVSIPSKAFSYRWCKKGEVGLKVSMWSIFIHHVKTNPIVETVTIMVLQSNSSYFTILTDLTWYMFYLSY